ncbi:hypothetical protein WN55_00762 [Dufourea novaeangliae]|uniref:Uncharacterized protein n=1 Tax=Dufourea novaeangliae TaxID=178035 RepID=A0A154PD49_DUFNO|nr:hypothetical protein WN55_00762 [Dufourea novaeangliae]
MFPQHRKLKRLYLCQYKVFAIIDSLLICDYCPGVIPTRGEGGVELCNRILCCRSALRRLPVHEPTSERWKPTKRLHSPGVGEAILMQR